MAAILNWGFIGASRISRRALLPAFRQSATNVVVSVAARDPVKAEAYAAEEGLPRWHASYEALLADPEIGAVYNSLTNDQHLPWTLKALEAGKHVLCEKPLVLDAAEVRTLQAAERASGKRVMEAFCYPFHPQIDRLRDIVRGGEIGRLVSIETFFGNPLKDAWDFRWTAAMGGGALYDLGTYCIGLSRLVAGREPIRVAATQQMRGDVDESFHGVLDFGAFTAIFGCSFVAASGQRLIVTGTEGVIHMDWPVSSRGRTTTLTLNGDATSYSGINCYLGMIEHFRAAVGGETALLHGLDDGLNHAIVLDALFAAARTGQVVAIGGAA